MKTIAAIDVGSNSVLLSIARVKGNTPGKPIVNLEDTPRLASGLKETGRISEQSTGRLIRVLRRFKRSCDEHGVEEISCCGTSALREASNSIDVISEVEVKTGISIEVISGRREAALTYLGAVTGMKNLRQSKVLIDAGGGSSEVVIARGTKIHSAHSYKIGSVVLMERFGMDRKKSARELESVLECIREQVVRLRIGPVDRPASLVCSGGTPAAIQGYRIGMKQHDSDSIHGASMKLSEYKQLIFELGQMSLSERRLALAFEPKRAEVITAGGLLSYAIAEQTGLASVRVSDRSLRFGLLYELAGRKVEFA
ncbi:MAG: hypothetical protein ABIK83_05430 [Candidatus Zixiibacteriota bacterium]